MMEEFIAKLRGRHEVPPVNTGAFGFAQFITNKDCTKIKFLLEVNDIENYIQTHIHIGARDQNGPVIVFLFGADLATLEEQNGISTRRGVTTGIIKDEDIVENDVGVDNIRELLKLMRKELTYVNAHTEQNPGGEIRGQITPIHKRY